MPARSFSQISNKPKSEISDTNNYEGQDKEMSKELDALIKYFHAGTAEGDESFLNNVFVPFEDYLSIISVPPGGPRLLVGNKGSGKSALLRYFRSQMSELEIPTILLRPKDIKINEYQDNALGGLTRICEEAILRSIAQKIGSGIKGLVINEDDKQLLTEAKNSGNRTEDAIEKLSKALAPIGSAITNIDFGKLKLGASEVGVKRIRESIESNLGRTKKCFYVLIDDTDQIAHPGEKGHLNRIWAFFLASRAITEDCPNIKFIISIRDEVWRRLKRDDAGQRDQVDHFRNLIVRINLTDAEIKKILLKRLELINDELGEKPHISQYNTFFESNHVRIPSTEEEFRYWEDFIVKRSRERPRDSIQLIYKLAEYASKNGDSKVLSTHVEKVMPIYSEERVDDLKRECELECPQIKDVIRRFATVDYDAGAFTLDPQTTADFLNSLTTMFSIKLFSKALRPNDTDSTFELWRFLHEIGFLNARVSDNRMDKGFRHISPNDDPDLVSPGRWQEMQGMTWEIHPSYRDYLIKVQKEKSFSFGKPKKVKKKKNRR